MIFGNYKHGASLVSMKVDKGARDEATLLGAMDQMYVT